MSYGPIICFIEFEPKIQIRQDFSDATETVCAENGDGMQISLAFKGSITIIYDGDIDGRPQHFWK